MGTSATHIGVNQPIPFVLNLHDGSEVAYPQVTVRDTAGALLFGGPIDLTHIGEGRYQNLAYSHATLESISAVYIIYSDALHTTEDTMYQRSQDVFVIVEEGEVAAGKTEIIGVLEPPANLSGILGQDVSLKGKLNVTNLEGRLNADVALQGQIIPDTNLTTIIECDP